MFLLKPKHHGYRILLCWVHLQRFCQPHYSQDTAHRSPLTAHVLVPPLPHEPRNGTPQEQPQPIEFYQSLKEALSFILFYLLKKTLKRIRPKLHTCGVTMWTNIIDIIVIHLKPSNVHFSYIVNCWL